MKKILCFVLAIVCLLAVAGCGGHAPQQAGAPVHKESHTEKVLRVGTDADYPPFEYYQESTKAFIGFDVELIQGVAREAGYSKVEFVDLEFNNLLPSLKILRNPIWPALTWWLELWMRNSAAQTS